MLILRFPLTLIAEKLQAIVELSVVQLGKLGNKWLIRSMFTAKTCSIDETRTIASDIGEPF